MLDHALDFRGNRPKASASWGRDGARGEIFQAAYVQFDTTEGITIPLAHGPTMSLDHGSTLPLAHGPSLFIIRAYNVHR